MLKRIALTLLIITQLLLIAAVIVMGYVLYQVKQQVDSALGQVDGARQQLESGASNFKPTDQQLEEARRKLNEAKNAVGR